MKADSKGTTRTATSMLLQCAAGDGAAAAIRPLSAHHEPPGYFAFYLKNVPALGNSCFLVRLLLLLLLLLLLPLLLLPVCRQTGDGETTAYTSTSELEQRWQIMLVTRRVMTCGNHCHFQLHNAQSSAFGPPCPD
jgi:hypothetical protein